MCHRVLSFVVAIFVCTSVLLFHPSSASAQLPNKNLPAKKTNADNKIEVIIPTVDGTLVWKDVANSIGESLSLDGPTLEKMFPTGSLDLRSPTTILVLFGIDMALGDAISIQMTSDAKGQPALRLRCDRKSLGVMAPKARETEPIGIQIDDDWIQRSAQAPLIICFHGLKSHPSKFDSFREFMRTRGFATAAIRYDDHQSIRDSAQQFGELTTKLFSKHGQLDALKLVLVGHSMGGLVAREWLENTDVPHCAAKVTNLITVGTPHDGSNWASLPPLLDLFAEGSLNSQDLVDVLLHKPSAPGMRELAPESRFLTEMRSRPRTKNVRYTTIVGTKSPVAERELVRLRETLQRLDQEGSMLRLIRPRIQPLLQSFDELARGKGDGVVAVERATIKGVDDIVRVEMTHIDMVSAARSGDSDDQPVWQAILKRLQ